MKIGALFTAASGLLVATAVGLSAYALWPTKTRAVNVPIDVRDPQAIARGRYIADASDCFACHTIPGGPPFAGGVKLHTPIGVIYASNITPDPRTGIGGYSLDDFDRALRHGIRKDGTSLYPAMPYPSYARLTDQDVADLYAYFSTAVPAAEAANKRNDIPFPLSLRWTVALWRKCFAPDVDRAAFDAARYPNAQIARGAYLVQTAGHCGSCHTPLGVALNEKGLDDSTPTYLAGGQQIDGWTAVNLRGDKVEGLGNWSRDDIFALLKSGRNSHSASAGDPMNEVIQHSTQKLSDPDLTAIASYLKYLSPAGKEAGSFAANDATAKMLAKGESNGRGADIYVDSCSACHFTNGLGSRNAIPALAGNISVLAPNAATLVRVILAGARMPATAERPSELGMPGFAWRYSDDEIAAVATFVRNSWGNSASAVSEDMVKKVRDAIESNNGSGLANGQTMSP